MLFVRLSLDVNACAEICTSCRKFDVVCGWLGTCVKGSWDVGDSRCNLHVAGMEYGSGRVVRRSKFVHLPAQVAGRQATTRAIEG